MEIELDWMCLSVTEILQDTSAILHKQGFLK